MAIDTKSVSQLIAEFRKLQAKNAITPEPLGYILQRLADKDTVTLERIIENVNNLVEWVSGLQKGVADALEIARTSVSKSDLSASASSGAAEKALNISTKTKEIRL